METSNQPEKSVKHRAVWSFARLQRSARNLSPLLIISLPFAGCEKEASELSSNQVAKSENVSTSAVADFSIIVMPDTQHYMAGYFGGTYAMFTSQIDWIKANKNTQNIVYVAGVGDVVEHGDESAYSANEWPEAATNGYYRLESSSIPYGLAVGNHDQTPINASINMVTTTKFTQYFGRNHFYPSKTYYGGNMAGSSSNNNDSHYDFFTAGGTDFMVIFLEYDHLNEQSTVLNDWAYNLCTTYSTKKVIIVTHYALQVPATIDNPAPFGTQGYRIWNRVKDRTNVIMILGGHIPGPAPDFVGEGYREDTYNGHTIRSYLSDYQQRNGGGNGRLRIMTFSVDGDDVSVKTYSPFSNTYEKDINSQFTKPLFGGAPTAVITAGKYKIVPKSSPTSAIVVNNGTSTQGESIVQYTYGGALQNDEWYFELLGTTGYYKLKNANSNLYMAVTNASVDYGAGTIGTLSQWPYSATTPNDEWGVIPVDSGYYKIIARHSGLCLNVAGGGTNDGALIKQWKYVSGDNEKFQIVAVP